MNKNRIRQSTINQTDTNKVTGPLFVETTDNIRLFCRDWGKGKPVVFVHSWAVNSDLWQYQMIDLIDHNFRCIGYDRRGHGRSGEVQSGFDCNVLADDLKNVIEQLDLWDVMLVGHSTGCGEIIRYLTRHGSERIDRAVLVGTTTPFVMKTKSNPDGVDRAILDQARAAWKKDFHQWLAENVGAFFVPETSPAMRAWALRMCGQVTLKAALDYNLMGIETDYRAEMANIDVPVLIIHGDKDASIPVELSGLKTAKLIPGSRLITYEGAPHGLMFTHMDRLNQDLVAFAHGKWPEASHEIYSTKDRELIC